MPFKVKFRDTGSVTLICVSFRHQVVIYHPIESLDSNQSIKLEYHEMNEEDRFRNRQGSMATVATLVAE